MKHDHRHAPSIKQKLLRILPDRTAQTLLAAAVMVLIMGSFRPDKSQGLYPKQFWSLKINWQHCADVVLAGDSRIYVSVNPADMQPYMPGQRIFNYGFAGNVFTENYLQAAEKVLDPQSASRTIILGIAPHSFTAKNLIANGFIDNSNMIESDKNLHLRFPGLLYFFEPMSFRDAWHGMFPRFKSSHTYREFHANGWIAIRSEPEDRSWLKRYQRDFTDYKVEPEIIETVIQSVKRWYAEGIAVYAFRPPSSQDMIDLENEMSGFDEVDFIKIFENAGGIWLNVDQAKYHSFDASHLHPDAAQKFSQDLAQLITEHKNK